MRLDTAVRLEPICGSALGEVGEFLHQHLNPRLSARRWSQSIVPTWPASSPNHGFLLREAGRVVGVQLAFYSVREIGDHTVPFCNLGALCVLEEHRCHGLRLVRAVLGQRSYHFTDLSPSGNVVALNERLGFETLETETAVVPHRPLVLARGARVVSDPAQIGRLLSGRDRTLFEDHRQAAAVMHLVVTRGSEHCYVAVRRERRKGLPVFASLLYVGHTGLLHRHLALLGRHLLLAHGLLATLIEVRLVGRRPPWSYRLPAPRPKMLRRPRGGAVADHPAAGPIVPAHAVDGLYSELAMVAW